MDAARLSQKVFAGYGKAAKRVGAQFDVYRPQLAADPLNVNNKITTIEAAFTIHNANNFSFDRPSDYNNPLFHGLFDPTGINRGDYFVDTTDKQGTFFVAKLTPAMPPLCVSCNRTVSFFEISTTPSLGLSSYSPTPVAQTEDAETALMVNWPVSLLKRGSAWDQYLPSDTGGGTFYVLCPMFPGVMLRASTIVVDDIGVRYAIEAAELQEMGWRLELLQMKT